MSDNFIYLSMLFLHIIDDFCLQQFSLAKLKQKVFWQENAPNKKYKSDFCMALVMHGFSWAFMIMLPIAYKMDFNVGDNFTSVFMINAAVHAIVDHIKANEKGINLIQDQLIHLAQIIVTIAVLI